MNSALLNVSKANLQNFNIQEKIGQGGFSKVYKAEFIKSGHTVAIKQMNKAKLILKQMTRNVMKEKQILSSIYHPFIVNMYATFQDADNVYIVMDYCSNSDFRNQLQLMREITEEQIKFFAGCIILGLEYIHSQGIIHRDLKPENIICDAKGFLRLSDFGIAKLVTDNEETLGKYEICGTPGFISPEIIKGEKIGNESDYFSLGVILYEIVLNKRPYAFLYKNEVVNENVILTQEECDNYFSPQLCDFITKLIELNPKKRLGRNGINEIKAHPFFEGFNWKQLFYKTIKVPWTPKCIFKKKINISGNGHKRKKSTASKDSKETNDSDESIYNNNSEFRDFDFLRTPKINCYTSFYNAKLIHHSNSSCNISNSNLNHNNIKLHKNNKKHMSLISPSKSMCRLILNKHSSSSNIQLYLKKLPPNNNNSFIKEPAKITSKSKNLNCNLPNISQVQNSFVGKMNPKKQISINKHKWKPKTASTGKKDINIIKKEILNVSMNEFHYKNNPNIQVKNYNKFIQKKNVISKNFNRLNLSSLMRTVKLD